MTGDRVSGELCAKDTVALDSDNIKTSVVAINLLTEPIILMDFSGISSLNLRGLSIIEPVRLAVNPATDCAYDLVMFVEKSVKP